MSLRNYIGACATLAAELADSLSEKDVDDLRANLNEMTRIEWLTWVGEHHKIVAWFLAATPSQRKKRKEWNEPSLRRFLVLAAIQMCERAEAVLEAANSLQPGASYRNTTADAVILYWKILSYWRGALAL